MGGWESNVIKIKNIRTNTFFFLGAWEHQGKTLIVSLMGLNLEGLCSKSVGMN